MMVDEFAGFRIKPKNEDEFLGLRIKPKTGDSNAKLIGKSIASGLLSNLDLPQNIGSFIEESANPEHGLIGQLRKGYNLFTGKSHEPWKAPTNFFSSLPSASGKVKKTLKEYGGIDLEPHPTTGSQKILSHVGEFAGSMGPFGLFSKFNKGREALKLAGTGAAIGGTSGVLQEAGVNPLVADIGTAGLLPVLPAGTKNLFNKFSKSHRTTKTEQRVADALKKQIGEENVPTVLENIKNYRKQKKPIKAIELTTPEIAQDIGLSRLYQTQGNLNSLAQRNAANQTKLLETLEGIGTTGLPESVKGEAIRMPFFERFNKKTKRREKITAPLYEELEAIEEGLNPVTAKSLLDKEIEVASPGNKPALEKYRKGLIKNKVNPQDIEKAQEIEKKLRNIDKEYQYLNPSALEQIKAPFEQELLALEKSFSPRPIQIENTIQELGDKVNAFSRTGEINAARKYGGVKKALEQDLSTSKTGLKHREEYKRLSKPINEIETSSLLNNFIKKNKDVSQLEGFIAPSEKIPDLILNSDLANTKILINKAKGNKELLSLIKGTYIDKLLETSKLSSGVLSYDKANKFINNKYNKEKLNLIFNNKERAKIEHYLDVLQRRNKVLTAGKMGGSDTQQKLKIESEFNDSLSGLGKLAEKTGLNAIGLGNIGSALWDMGRSKLKAINNNKYNSVLEEALLDPNTFKRLMENKRQLKTFEDFYNPIPSLTTGINLNSKEK
jgi:hypothetical protein